MTTIILTIIGIILASAAALMVVSYGGTAYISTADKAAASTLQNNATNVMVAAKLYKSVFNAQPADLPALYTAGSYLTEAPPITGIATGQSVSGGLYEVSGVSDAVCAQVNTNLAVDFDVSTSGVRAGTMGCNVTDLVFYASL